MRRQSRRTFLTASAAAFAAPAGAHAKAAPLLRTLPSSTLKIASVELLKNRHNYLVRLRTTDGLEGISVPNVGKFPDTYPIFLNRVAPFFVGKDARDIERLLPELYRHRSNYKFQGLAFWIGVAAAEMAVLDLLGKALEKPVGELFGPIHRRDIPLYVASSHRGNTPEAEVSYFKKRIAETGARAIKFRLGGRMSTNADSLPGRSEALIPLMRQELGPDLTLMADSNSSYDVDNAVRIGRLMERHDYAFFEEPCPFDHLWETREVARQLEIPVAGGEQEFSMRRFRWAIENRAVDIVQPDLHYFGGYIRSVQVARLAEQQGLPCIPHMSGGGLGFLHLLHFASFVPNSGDFQEFKGHTDIPLECPTSSLTCKNGSITCPSGPGFGVMIDPDYIKAAKPVTTS